MLTQLLNDKQDEPELYEIERSLQQREHSASVEGRADINDDIDDDDMASQLNPDAIEFVPTSPQRTNNQSPFSNGSTGVNNNILELMMEDPVISQSPRKGAVPPMDDITLPLEDDFGEISKRPAEITESPTSDIGNRNGVLSPNGNVDHVPRPGSSNSQCSYQELNLKEAMHGDEKQEMAEEIADASDEQQQPIDFHVSGMISERDPLNTSFYDNDANNPFVTNANVDMNAVQTLPDDSSDENETLAFDGNHKPDLTNLLDNQFMSEAAKQEGAFENGTHYSIQDTDFGMGQDGPAQNQFEILGAQRVDAIANGFNNLLIDGGEQITPDESAKPELIADTQLSSSIAAQVHELATQVTSVLNDFDAKDKISSFDAPQIQDQSIPSPQPDFASRENVINTDEFSQNASDAHFQQNEVYGANDSAASDIIFFANVPSAPIDVPAEEEPRADVPAVPERQTDDNVERQTDDNIVEIIAAASVAAVTAVAAASVTVAAKPSASIKSKPEAKKPEVKSRTLVSAASPTAKKTAAVPLKSARPALGASPAKAIPAKASSAPVTARTVRAAPAKAQIEKKSTITATTTAARKPLTNGTGSASAGLKKTTTTTTVTKTTANAAKPSVTTARANLGPKPATTTTTKSSTATTRPIVSLTASKVASSTKYVKSILH